MNHNSHRATFLVNKAEKWERVMRDPGYSPVTNFMCIISIYRVIFPCKIVQLFSFELLYCAPVMIFGTRRIVEFVIEK